MAITNNPLGVQEKQDIDDALQRIREAKELIALAERSEIDTGDYKSLLAEQERKLMKIKANFFPNG